MPKPRCRSAIPLSAVSNVFSMQGEGYQARFFQCEFTEDLVLDGTDVKHHTEGVLHQVGHTERRFTGYMLVCDDPGPDYNYFVFVRYGCSQLVLGQRCAQPCLTLCYHAHLADTTDNVIRCSRSDFSGPGKLLKSVAITPIDTEESGVGLCLASLYSPRVGFDNWVLGTIRAGFTNIYVYYTTVKDRAALNPHYGTVEAKGDFVPEDLPDVQYFYFQAPARTWTFAQSTLYTECIHRNRLKHKFLAIADADEFFWRPASNESLQEFLSPLFPNNTASLVWPDIMYPEPCQEHRSYGKGVNPLTDSHFYFPTKDGTQPKSIIMPARSLIHRVHTLAHAEPGYACCKDMPPSVGYWKHVRQRRGGCTAHDRAGLLDDRDESTFQTVMQNESLWIPAYS